MIPARLAGPPMQVVAQVVRDTVTDCPDLVPFLDLRAPLGAAHLARTSYELGWWVRFFDQDPHSLARFHRIQTAIPQAFYDCASLAKATTGASSRVPRALLELLQQRTALAYYPSADQIADQARHGSPAFAREALRRYIRPEPWREQVS